MSNPMTASYSALSTSLREGLTRVGTLSTNLLQRLLLFLIFIVFISLNLVSSFLTENAQPFLNFNWYSVLLKTFPSLVSLSSPQAKKTSVGETFQMIQLIVCFDCYFIFLSSFTHEVFSYQYIHYKKIMFVFLYGDLSTLDRFC